MDGETITTETTPTDILYKKVYDAKYAGVNRVFDIVSPTYSDGIIAITDFTNALNAGGHASGRSSIKYSNSEINLFFPITTNYMQQCCDGHLAAGTLDCNGAVTNALCQALEGAGGTASTTDQADTLILKIIANSNALSLNNDDKDSSTAAGNLYKGVELYPSGPSSTGAVGMFGMAKVPDSGAD